jgi:hypothetical protein
MRVPLRTPAPTVTGRAARRASPAAASRVSPRRRATVSAAPERETPGERRGLGQPDRQVVERVRLRATLGRAVREEERDAAQHLRDRHRARAAQPPLDRPLEEQAHRGRREQGEGEPARLAHQAPAQRERQRRRRPGVQGDLERLAHVPGELRVLPPEQPRHERHVAGARHREQLGRALERPEQERLAQRERGQIDSGAAPARRRRRARTTR